MKFIALLIASAALLTAAHAEQGDAEDRALIEQRVSQAQTPAVAPVKANPAVEATATEPKPSSDKNVSPKTGQ
jgi:hypothetical protein